MIKIKYGFSGKTSDLARAVEETLLEEPWEAGRLEALQDQADSVSHLLTLLVDKGVLTLDDVNQVVGPLYEFEEVKS